MPDRTPDDALDRLLRAGDPAAGAPGLDAVERSAMRRRILAARREPRPRPDGWWVPATTVVALLALALGLALLRPADPPPRTAGLSPAASPAVGAAGGGQQVQFTTENGTLVVWVLTPRSTG